MESKLVEEIFKLNVETQKIAKRKEAIQEAEKAKDKKWHTWEELTTDAMESIIEAQHGHGGICKEPAHNGVEPHFHGDQEHGTFVIDPLAPITGDPIKDNIEAA